jgi:hypothetical protein
VTLELAGLAPADLLKPYADLAPLTRALDANDPESIEVRAPLRIEQGVADTTVFPTFTDQLVDVYEKAGTKLTYDKVGGIDHGGIVTSKSVQRRVLKWIRKRVR